MPGNQPLAGPEVALPAVHHRSFNRPCKIGEREKDSYSAVQAPLKEALSFAGTLYGGTAVTPDCTDGPGSL